MAQIMMEYLPNALAFVFVVNTQSGGGVQDDRVTYLLKPVCHQGNVVISYKASTY